MIQITLCDDDRVHIAKVQALLDEYPRYSYKDQILHNRAQSPRIRKSIRAQQKVRKKRKSPEILRFQDFSLAEKERLVID